MTKLIWQKEMYRSSSLKYDRKRRRVMRMLQMAHNLDEEMYRLLLDGLYEENQYRINKKINEAKNREVLNG